MFRKRGLINNKGQVTIFIIIAILVIALAVLAYFFIPGLRSNVSQSAQSPSEFIETCIKEKIQNTIETISLQGGDFEIQEESSYFYKGDYLKYLCYINEYYKPCIIQEPFLKEHFEQEIKNEISNDVNSCFESMVANYRNKGYEVTLKNSETDSVVEISPYKIVVNFDNELILKKSDTENYDSFYIILNSNLYELLDIAKNILVWEIDTGDSITEAYMTYDPYVKVEKRRKSDETKVYILTDRRTDEVFQFAVRSWALPPGYT